MATREENLKKINAELELMSDEDLDRVAAGGMFYNETVADSLFLNDLAGLTDRYGAARASWKDAKISNEVTAAWNKIGISVGTKWSASNTYFIDGKEITRQEAYRIACEKYGKDLSSMPGGYNFY